MRKTKKQRFRASILAILLIASMVFGMVPNSAGQVYAKESTSSSSEEEPGFIDKAINFFQDTGDKIASFFGAGDEAAPAAAFDTEKEADKNTLQEWKGIAKETTENIGRIWTDKTVSTTDMKFEAFSGGDILIGDSQFLVALSALSSTSNTVTTSSKPLDIVLVLDVSGSMGDPLGTVDVYNEAYNIDESWKGPDYFAKVNDEYVQIDRKTTSLGWFLHWELNGKSVEPKTSANDSAEGHIQFYTKKTQDVSKMDGLKNAVNGFIEATAKENDQIQDKAKQHKISVVKFADDSYNESYGDDLTGDDYNYTQRLNPLTSYTSETVSELTDKVNKLQEAGATSADYGLTMAQTELKANGRKDAQKVVIFFTDGEPNHKNGFSDNVANTAISASQELKKDEKAIVYSVGVFKDADPNNTSTNKSNCFNAYMHGISSNYPEATKWNSLGTRVENSDYYKAASNADDLNKIFEDILQDVNSGSGFPTDIQDGYEPNKGGYVTFDDKLGAYMQVDEFKSIIFADQKFDLNSETGVKTEKNVTTYTFEGEGGNSLYPNGNLHDILITVTKSKDLAVGDQVKVRIPASMIPLRHFNVDTDADGQTTMEVTSAWPIRIVYGASIKPGVEETLRDGLDDGAVDQALETYLKNNQADINGKAAAFFYSNLYTGKPWQGHDGQTLGDTVASFDPAKGNIFYYFTENTPIYTDEEFTQPVKGKPESGVTYYYKKVFWALEEGKPVEKTIAYPFASDNFDQASASWATNESSGEVYIKAGSAKLTRVDALTLSKDQNTTNTATEIINLQWDNVNNPQTLQVYLGNNGRIAMEVPGALEITKDATVAADKNLNEEEIVKDKEFTFNISIPEMKGKTVKAEKRNLQGDIQGEVFDLSFDNAGNAKAVLKDNEKIYIHGLDAGIEYTVTEDTNSMPAGFKLTAIDGKKATEATEATGTIVAGSAKQHTFTNTYDVTTISAEAFAPYEKVFDRWDLAGSFKMMLTADDASYPMPEGAQNGQKIVEATEEKPAGDFGKITFTAPGTYGYTIVENVEEADKVLGVDYSMASYDVEVKVEDNGDGTLSVASVVIRQIDSDDGTPIPEGEQSPVEKAVFTNTFNADSASLAAIVMKEYTDTAGGSLKNGQFQFKMTPREDLDEINNPDIPDNRPTLPEEVTPDPTDRSITVSNSGAFANFGMATYSQNCVGNTYAYELTEVVPEGVTAENPKLNGMTYDLSRYLVKMAVSSQEGADGSATVVVKPTYYKIKAGEQLESIEGSIPVFRNGYDPEDLVIPSEGNAAIHGSKTLEGRNSLDGESFTFTLTAANEAAQTALANDWILFEGDAGKTDMTAAVTGIKKGIPAGFDFGEVKITRPGVYQFNVVENAPENGKGMVYDRHTALVTVTVTDNAGKLEGKVTYNNGQDASTSEAAFTNTYTASTTYGEGAALNLSKTLNGRNQAAGEFNFQIAGQDKAADQKLVDTDRKFATIAQANDGVASLIFNKMSGVRFTEADAGKTFSYVVKEVLPEDDDVEVEGVQSKGVTYTQTQYRVDIQVNDNGDGTMSTVTTVSRTHDEEGVRLQSEEVLGTYNSKDGKDDIRDISFVNSYAAKSVTVNTDTDANVKLTKQLKGRSWKGTDRFDFTLTAKNPTNAPLPVKDEVQTTTAAVTQPEGTAEDAVVEFGFGTITFDKPGEYYYQVTEQYAGQTINGITYDETPASVWVSVKDPGDGQLTATVSANGTDFVNTYAASLRHNAAGGIVTTKTLHGHDMANRQFTFKVEALAGTGTTAKENAERIDIKDGTVEKYRNDKAATDGTMITMKTEDGNDIEFTADDVGKTFKYQFSEMGADDTFGTGGTKDGYTYDKAVYTVEMWVTDDGDGTLTLHTKVNDGAEVLSDETKAVPTVLDFTNRYAASGKLEGTANLAGTKKIEGPWEATGKDLSGFQFTITGGDEATNTALEAGDVTLPTEQTVASNEKGNFNFGDITFKKKGTYTFTVSEVVPADNNKVPGVSYEAKPVTITVHVTDNDNGTLTAELAEGSPELIFTNTYATTQDATFTPSVVKSVEGLDAKEKFKFKLSATDEATTQAIENGTITGIGTVADPYSSEKTTTELIQKGKTEQVDFNALTFKKAGTYKFTVNETYENAPTGWTYDSHTYEITINVTDVDSVLTAQMKATNPNTNSQIFTNSFAATTTYGEEGGLNVTKTLDGRTLKADMFNFTIAGQATYTVTAEQANEKLEDTDKNFKNTEPGENGVAVMSKLGTVEFDETDIGKTYQYAVQEITGTDTKYTYDNVSATVAIQVLEKDGGLYTVTTVTKGEDVETYSSIDEKATAVAPFVNRYTPEIVNVDPGKFAGNVTKVLEGNRGTALAADEFNFQMTITPADDTSSMDHVVLPEGANNGTVTAANAANGLVSFGNIQFRAAGTYHVEISEVIPEEKDPNMTYDKHTFSYDIAVTYNAAEGTLSAAVAEGSTKGNATFTNIYEADDAKDVANTDDPTTSVNGKIVGVGDQLTYTIDWVNNAVDDATGAPTKARVTITDKVPTGTEYVSAKNEGAYDEGTNTITWTLGEQEAGASGTVSFVVKVLDSAGGTDVTNKAQITVGSNNPEQTNEVTTNVPGKDSVVEEGGELQVGKVLTYTISYMNPEEEAATVTIKDIIPDGLDYVDGSAGEFASYDAETRTLTWEITDVQPKAEGTVTFDAKVNESAKTVIYNKATIQIGDNAPTYDTNTDQKEIPKDGNLAISKTIALAEGQGTEINKEQTFTFTVELKDAKGAALTKEYAYTVTGENGEEIKKGNATNGTEISFQHGQKAVITGLPAGAQYTVTETEVAGYTTSVNGQVSNVASGTITADATAAVDFTNTYSVAGSLSGSDALTVTKELVGREWLDTDTFVYELTAADETTKKAVEGGFITLPDNAGNLEITKESAEHKAAFGDIQFTIAGTFKFNVTEQPSSIAGITDDQNAERTVVVKVTDKKDGTLEAIVDDKSENLTFTNTYGASTGDEDIAARIQATKKLTGRDMKAEEFQFEVVTRKADEAVEGFKEEVVATGTNEAAKADAAGIVTFAEKDEVKLSYTVESLNQAVEDGYAVKEVHDGQAVWMVSYTARELTTNLPGGVTAVEEKTSYNFTIVVTDNNDGTLTAAVQAPEGGIAFENAYTTGGTEVDTDPTDAAAYFSKKLVGRDWLDTDEFTFTITPQNGAPAPQKITATVKKADAKAGDSVPFGFGKITFTDKDMAGATANEDGTLSKTFTYEITENDIDAEKMPGVTKDSHVATLTIIVTDNQQGELSASANMTAENGTFTNTYKSSLDYTALSGLQITKVLNGRDMADGQFSFTVTPGDKDSADKLGLTEEATEFTNTAKPAGEVDTMDVLAGKNVTFTQADAGKTFTYTVKEIAGGNNAYIYDDTPRKVTIEVKDNKNATLTVTTTVKKGSEVVDTQSVTTGGEDQKKATVAFENTYNADPTTLGGEGNVKINAKKSLTNRPMVAGEFKFHVKDNKGGTVTSGTNSTDGTITFAPVTYDTDKLIKDAKAGIAAKSVKEGAYVYTYDYKVVEDDSNFADGVTGIHTSFPIKVIVTDDGKGNLSIEVVYPEGSENVLTFKNIYGADGSAVLNINGHKALEVESGDNIPNITGEYTFTIEGSEGAPMPEKTEAKNDAVGNVDFGTIQYTMENVFGSEPAPLAVDNTETDETGVEPTAESDEVMPVKSEERTKEFTYTVKESGNVAGVDNDKKSEKTFKVTVTDNGDGTIKVDGPKGFAFEFTNTYSVDPVDYSINTDLTINKELDGRELREGEFTFELVSEDGKVVSTATNSADGSVAFKAITYKTPGTYNYVIREQKGSAGGVEYDSAEHTVVVVVTDNGNGIMTAKAELKSRAGEDAKNAIVFKNSYTAQPASVTLGASKAYTGGKLGDGQFTFELRDESDKLISKVKNNENGQIVFETIEYKNVGTYKYKISEVNDEQKHVTYDKTVYGVTVTVTDNGEGSLMATVEYDGGKAPVFTNKYSKPAKPAKPEEPKGPTAVKTGDEAPVIPFIILMVATLAIIVTITFIFFRRKRR